MCVRYRQDAVKRIRYTTVELVVAQSPIRRRLSAIVGVRIGYGEVDLRRLVKQHGASWDPEAKLHRMPYRVARELRLEPRIVEG